MKWLAMIMERFHTVKKLLKSFMINIKLDEQFNLQDNVQILMTYMKTGSK